MKSLIHRISNKLRSKKGETLVEAIISILLLTILLSTITAMISTSRRMTARSMETAREMQNETFNPAASSNPDRFIPGGEISFSGEIETSDALITIDIASTHNISIFDDDFNENIIAFSPELD